MRASVLTDVAQIELRDWPRPTPTAGEVLVQMEAVGVCGTDFHIYSGESNYNLDSKGNPVPLTEHPQVLGHELVGSIVELGAGVNDLRVGQRVVIDQGLNCHSQARASLCEYCASGDSHQCEHYREHGITGLPGGLSEYLAIPAVNAVAVQDGLEARLAALTEPLSCVLHSLDTVEAAAARYRLCEATAERRVRHVLICGAGPAGLLFLQVLQQLEGFKGRVLVSEPDAHKRALAEDFGAVAIDPTHQDLVDAVQQVTDGRGVEVLIEATGSGPLFLEIPGLIRKQATLVLYGHGHAGASLEALNAVQWREPTLLSPIGASGGFDRDHRPSVYRRALDAITQQRIQVESLLTHTYSGLQAVPQAFGGDHRQPGYVKGVVLL